MAEGVGFEPTSPFGKPVFKTGAIVLSATPPGPPILLKSRPQCQRVTAPSAPCASRRCRAMLELPPQSFYHPPGGDELKVIKIQEVPAEPVEGGIFIGGEVSRQPLVTEDMGPYFSMSNVSFGPGARNKLHTHSSDQVPAGHCGHRHCGHGGERGCGDGWRPHPHSRGRKTLARRNSRLGLCAHIAHAGGQRGPAGRGVAATPEGVLRST